LGDLTAAAANYTQVINLNPFNEDASLAKGFLFIKEGKSEEAVALFDELLELNPELVQAYRGRGKAKRLNGNEKEALEDEEQADKLEAAGKDEDVPEGKPANFNDIYKGGIF
jgi:tetratricopeptide (TPR) repeat protein